MGARVLRSPHIPTLPSFNPETIWRHCLRGAPSGRTPWARCWGPRARKAASQRNISDGTMAMIAEAGGLIGVGFWADVTCGEGIDAIVSAIR